MSTSATRHQPLDALRTLVTLLVVLHHSLLAYVQMAPPRSSSLDVPMLLWAAFPVVDPARWPGFDLLTTFNDTFFMALLFLVSGVFTPASLRRKGAAAFLRDRLRKLGLAFLFAAGVVAPLAYFAAYRALAPQPTSFWHQWLHLGVWPAGPAWFLWVLLAFDLVAAALYAAAPSAIAALGRLAARVGDRPVRALAGLVAVSGVAYLAMVALYDPLRWVSFGPFFVQIGRLGLYFVFFVAGAALGAWGLDRGLLVEQGALARRWGWWLAAALVFFIVALATWLTIFAAAARGPVSTGLATFGNVLFPLTCATTSFAVLAAALRFLRRPPRLLAALTPNAFGIYVVHYAFVAWLQLALLAAPFGAPLKALLVFTGAVLGSWGVTAAARRIGGARRRKVAPAAAMGVSSSLASR